MSALSGHGWWRRFPASTGAHGGILGRIVRVLLCVAGPKKIPAFVHARLLFGTMTTVSDDISESPGWLSQRTWFELRDSGTHGLGVYALRALPAGIPLFAMGGPTRRGHELAPGERALQVGEDLWIVEDAAANHPENFLNHHCAPNMGFVEGDLVLWSLRPIRAGEELTWDYSSSIDEAGWYLDCGCGHVNCRGRVVGFHALTHAERGRLMPVALRWLRRRYGLP